MSTIQILRKVWRYRRSNHKS